MERHFRDALEEEVVFDHSQFGLLNNSNLNDDTQTSPTMHEDSFRKSPAGRSRYRGRLLRTAALCGAYVSLGMCMAVTGPTLLYLKDQVGSTMAEISWIFTARSAGTLGGSFAGGLILDRFNPYSLFFLAVASMALGTGAMPWCKHLWMMVVSSIAVGFANGFLDTGASTLCLQLWGKDSGPYMQAMHFAFAVGGFLTPLLVQAIIGDTSLPGNTTIATSLLSASSRHVRSVTPSLGAQLDNNVTYDITTIASILQAVSQEPLPSYANGNSSSTDSAIAISTAVTATEKPRKPKPEKISGAAFGDSRAYENIPLPQLPVKPPDVDTTTSTTPNVTTTIATTAASPPSASNFTISPDINQLQDLATGNVSSSTIALTPTATSGGKSIELQLPTLPPQTAVPSLSASVESTFLQPVTSAAVNSSVAKSTEEVTAWSVVSTSAISTNVTPTPTTTSSTTAPPTITTSTTLFPMTSSTAATSTTTTSTSTTTTTTTPPTPPTGTRSTISPPVTVASVGLASITSSSTAPSVMVTTSFSPLVDFATSDVNVTKSRGKSRGQQYEEANSPTFVNKSSPASEDYSAVSPTIKESDGEVNSHPSGKTYVTYLELFGVTRMHLLYTVIAIIVLHTAFSFLFFHCSSLSSSNSSRNSSVSHARKRTERPAFRPGHLRLFVLLLFIFYLLYVGSEVVFAQFLTTFALESQLHLPTSTANYVTTTFWAAFAATRFTSIFLAHFVSPTAMLVLNFGLTTTGSLALCISGQTSLYVLYIGSALLGVGMASTFATGFVWTEQHLLVTNRISAAFSIASSMGEMIFPAVTGALMEKNVMSLMYVVLSSSILCVAAFVVARYLAERQCRSDTRGYHLAQQADDESLTH